MNATNYNRSTLYHIVLLVCFSSSYNNVTSLKSENIVGGSVAREGGYKYYVSLQRSNGHFCGATIIDDYHIITAAHCVVDSRRREFMREKIYAARRKRRIGENDNDIIGEVDKVFVTRKFAKGTDDIAVLKLNSSLKLNRDRSLNKINIARVRQNYVGRTAEVLGSGSDAVQSCVDIIGNYYSCYNQTEYRLKVMRTKIISNKECQSYSQALRIKPTYICAKPSKKNPGMPEGICDGDSGGPLILDSMLIGVISQGPSTCDETLLPSIYTQVWSYISFIRAAVTDLKTNTIRVAKFYPLYSSYIEIKNFYT